MSEVKESKVKEIKGIKPYNGTYGMIYYFTVEMENGDKGEVSKKSESGLKVGSPLKYSLETKNGYVKLKEFKENNGFRGGGSSASPASIALQAAASVVSANIIASGKPLAMDLALSKKITSFATDLSDWLKKNQ